MGLPQRYTVILPFTPEAAKLTVRLDPAMIRRIDEARAKRPVRLSRNQWIIEAIHGHLENGGDHTGRS